MSVQRRILILTTGKGGGHRSSSNAIEEAIHKLDTSVDVKSIDAMEFMPGYSAESNDETGYISLTTKYRFFWKLMYEFSSRRKEGSNRVLAHAIFRRFSKKILELKPDVILSVHPCFVGSVILCLEKMHMTIPVCTCIIDLVKHSRLWHDTKCAITFVPTKAMFRELQDEGFADERLVHSGFPVRAEFKFNDRRRKNDRSHLNILMVNPSLERDEVTLEMVRIVLKFSSDVTVVTGSDRHLKQYLDESLQEENRVEVLGYVTDMQKRLSKADVVITKAGPNIVLEAVRMCVPILITGHILGQEEENHNYVIENGYGLKCESPGELEQALQTLLHNGRELMSQFSNSERTCADTDGAAVVAQHLIEILGRKTDDQTQTKAHTGAHSENAREELSRTI